MASSENPSSASKIELYDSTLTVPSDSENYNDHSASPSPPSSSSSPLVLYKPPTLWTIARSAAINLILPFVNGLMLGFGELFAHEAAFRLGWSNTKVCLFLFVSLFSEAIDGCSHMPPRRCFRCIDDPIPSVRASRFMNNNNAILRRREKEVLQGWAIR